MDKPDSNEVHVDVSFAGFCMLAVSNDVRWRFCYFFVFWGYFVCFAGTAADASAGANASVSSVESERQPHYHPHHPSPPQLSVLLVFQNRMPSIGSGGGCGKYAAQIDEHVCTDGR